MDSIRVIEVKESLTVESEKTALKMKSELKKQKRFLLNVMASPGSGKTSLIIETIENLKSQFRMAVIESDIESTVDAEKIQNHGIESIQLRTGGLCHLDACMVQEGIDSLSSKDLDFIIIENVGNLVCPAEFDTGAIKNLMILSIPEGDDKPLKYPLMFSKCDVLIVNKMDFINMSNFNLSLFKERVLKLNDKIKIIELSCKNKEGVQDWIQWIQNEVNDFIS